MELTFDERVSDIRHNSIWVRSATVSVEAAFKRQHGGSGVRLEFDKEESSEASDFSDSSSESDSSVNIQAVDNDIADFVSNGYETSYFDADDAPQPRRRDLDDGSRLAREMIAPQWPPVKRSGQARVRASTTMDDFYDSFPSGSARATSAIQTNFRLVGQQARSSGLWEWEQVIKKKCARARVLDVKRSALGSSTRANGIASGGFSSSSRLNKMPSKDTSGAVQAKLVHLRNERYRSQRQAYPPQQQQPVRIAARSSLSLANSFEPSEWPPPLKSKRPREDDRQSHVSDTTAGPNRVSWEAVFEVLPEFSMDSKAPSSAQASLLRFGHLITKPSVQEQLQTTGFVRFALSRDNITYRASRLRQQLTDLRLQEFEVLETLPSGAEDRDEGDVERTSAWLALKAQDDAYHSDIAEFCVSVVCGFKAVQAKDVIDILSVVLQELVQSLRQLPDCESLFVGCREYFFYFDVEAPNAKTTPLLSAVTRTYWYVLQLLFALQRSCERLQFPGQLKRHVGSILDPALDWIARAAMLFLFDWYLYLPSSHVCPEGASDGDSDNPTGDAPSDAPALSLWLSMFRCYRGDDEATPAATDGKKEFWIALKKLVRGVALWSRRQAVSTDASYRLYSTVTTTLPGCRATSFEESLRAAIWWIRPSRQHAHPTDQRMRRACKSSCSVSTRLGTC